MLIHSIRYAPFVCSWEYFFLFETLNPISFILIGFQIIEGGFNNSVPWMVGFYDLMSLSFSFLLLSYACLKQLNCTIQYLSVNSIPLLIFGKPHTNTINAVPLIRWRLESLPLKHMAQVSATTSAYDFSAQHTR